MAQSFQLQAEKQGKRKMKVVKFHLMSEMFVHLKDGETQVHGLLWKVSDSTMLVGSEEIAFEDVVAINGVTLVNWPAMAAGAGCIAVGYVWSGLIGGLFFLQGITQRDGLILFGSMLDILAGATLLAIGSRPFLKRSRRYRTATGWAVRGVPEEGFSLF